MNKILVLNYLQERSLRFSLRKRGFWRKWMILNCVLIIFLSALCVFQIIKLSNENYLALNYKKRIEEIYQENRELKILLSQKRTFEDLTLKAKELGFEPIEKIHYVKVSGGAVVKREK